MARPKGLEPLTLGLEGRCSIQLSYGRLATNWYEPLESHEPMSGPKKKVVGVERFELPTSCSQSRRATRLRYTPLDDVYHIVFERQVNSYA